MDPSFAVGGPTKTGAGLNCLNKPVLPAWLVRSNLNDPRRMPYLLGWKDERHDGEGNEAVRLAHFLICGRERNDCVQLKGIGRDVGYSPQNSDG